LAKDRKIRKAVTEEGGEVQEKLANGGKVISLDFPGC